MRVPFPLILVATLWAGFLNPALAAMEIIAHRGALSLAPENTLAAQRLAYENGADTVECDVRISKDGVPVIIHDHHLDRTTDGTGYMASLTVEELKRLDAGSWFGAQWAGERIPTLAEMLETAKTYNRNLLLDIKGQDIAPQVVQVIRESGISLHQISFLTWWTEMTAEYVKLLPGAKILRGPTSRPSGAAIGPDKMTGADFEAMRSEGVTVLCFHLGTVLPADIRRFQAAGFETSLIYPPTKLAFYYEDAGLSSFWTDFTDVTVSGQRRMAQQWANWADATGLGEDQCRTWQDADGDGVSNLAEFAFGGDPLRRDERSPPAPGFQVSGSSTRSPTATSLDWPAALREDWSRFLNVTPQESTGAGVWTDLPPGCCTAVTPAQLLYKFPIGTGGRKFYRLKFEVKH